MKLCLLLLLLNPGCATEPETPYSRSAGALGVTDGPPTNPSEDTGDTGDTDD